MDASHAQPAIPDVQRLHHYSPLLSSFGQPRRSHFPALAAAGYKLVVNLAPANSPEALRDERSLVEAAGMQYVFIPVDWDRPTLDQAAQVLDLLDRYRDVKVLVHCWVNSRASAFAYLHRTLRRRS